MELKFYIFREPCFPLQCTVLFFPFVSAGICFFVSERWWFGALASSRYLKKRCQNILSNSRFPRLPHVRGTIPVVLLGRQK